VAKRQPIDGAAEQDGGLGPADDPRLAWQTEFQGMVLDEAVAERVKVRMSVLPARTATSIDPACISSAARSVNVSARICSGRARLVAISQAMRRVTTCKVSSRHPDRPGRDSTAHRHGSPPVAAAIEACRRPATTSRSIGAPGEGAGDDREGTG
jgi:hypothetical protein